MYCPTPRNSKRAQNLIEEQVSGIPFVQMAKNLGVQGVLGIKHRLETAPHAKRNSQNRRWIIISTKIRALVGGLHFGISAFPNGKYDDQMDALSQFLIWRT